ncbi:small-conductance mechanosensitive channel [Xenococcus sp. PCC 7305]|uniref:mechanosensitive ion channel domain-containing protein n=1 Tax=Xenococcus sp. PCC 7305 TaxID=102125 RepID=UPI0002AC817E|nr:mechanosensitive ion channel domain-containing protein [Xenococcus sp. PCC 7305]ELS03357.1 small-conductance mechanosensitive channel [Xenococcus sp. PCC 7305]
MPTPILAQLPNKAPVVLDGQVLFEVGDFGIFSAKERAKKINQALIDAVRSEKEIAIEVVELDNQATIKDSANDQHLFTITQADIISAPTPYAQAIMWEGQLKQALQKAQQERSNLYRSKALFTSVGVFFLAITLHLGLRFLRRFSSYKISQLLRSQPKLQLWNKFLIGWEKLSILGLQSLIWLACLFYITNLFPQTRSWLYWLLYWLNSPSINLGDKSYSPWEIVFLLSLTVVVWFVVKFLTNAFKYYVLRQIGAEQEIQEIIAVFIQYIATFLALIILWQSWGLDLGALAITASVLGVGIGFGLQNIANNFISGLIIILERPIKIGDLIKVDEFVGTIKNIGFRSTEIITQDRIAIIIPNSQLLDNKVINWNHGDSISRLRISIGVSYNSDIRKVKTALLYAAKNHSEVLRTPRPQVWFQEFANSSLNFELLVWINDPQKQFRIKSDLNYLIAASLRQYNIEIPFPQRDINFSSPKLEQLLIAWLGYQGINASIPDNNYATNSKVPKVKTGKSEDFFVNIEDKLTAEDLEELVAQMRSTDGLNIRDRDYYLNFYSACFIGSEAVDWLVHKHHYNRDEAVEIGQIMLEKGIIHHVTDEHSFKDAYLFYRFYLDE